MKDINTFKVGEHVHYVPVVGKKENGIVKSLCEDHEYVFVVYNCAGEWDRYHEYTAARTNVNDLHIGWIVK